MSTRLRVAPENRPGNPPEDIVTVLGPVGGAPAQTPR
jgi:hypothetical protein